MDAGLYILSQINRHQMEGKNKEKTKEKQTEVKAEEETLTLKVIFHDWDEAQNEMRLLNITDPIERRRYLRDHTTLELVPVE